MQKSALTIRSYTDLLREFIAQVTTEKVSLVCHSMGGQVCIDFALAHPYQIHMLTLISPAGIYDKSAFVSGATKHFAGLSVGAIDHPYADTLGDLAWYNQDFHRRMIVDNPMLLIAIESFRENFYDRIQKLKTKTLIIWGRDDEIFNFENGIFLKENVEHSTLYVLDGAGHTPMKTHAAEIAKLIRKHQQGAF
jgi:pimeloyl-ACP methyl ester carboxylesterase